MSSDVTRREFLGASGKAAAGVAAGLSVHTLLREARAAEANERFTVALIGCGGMGKYKLSNFMDTKRCNVAAVCDVDDSRAEEAAQNVQKQLGTRPKKLKDY